jgi:osmoprotectant transport system ATP-binding protein
MGDRIAILRAGGTLAQYATPEEILARPADEFVAEFVGADRALKLLSLHTVGELELAPVQDGDAAATIDAGTSLRDALALLLSDQGRPLTVRDAAGRPQGMLTLEIVRRSLDGRVSEGPADEPVGSSFAGGGATS